VTGSTRGLILLNRVDPYIATWLYTHRRKLYLQAKERWSTKTDYHYKLWSI